jgi:hypothetical protein
VGFPTENNDCRHKPKTDSWWKQVGVPLKDGANLILFFTRQEVEQEVKMRQDLAWEFKARKIKPHERE